MKHIGLATFVFFTTLCATRASAESIEERGKRVINEAIQALGGEKFLNMQERVETGHAYSFFHEQLSGLSQARIYTRYLPVDPAKSGTDIALEERQSFGKKEDDYDILRNDGAWEITYRGAKPLERDQVKRFRDSTLNNLFYILRQRLHEPGIVFESRGADVIENAPVEIVDITDSQNRVVTAYFHQTTKLPVRQKWVWRDPETKEQNVEITRYSRYRASNGITWPQQWHRERNGEKVFELFSDTVAFNAGLPDNLFLLPGTILEDKSSQIIEPGRQKNNAKKK